MTENPWAAFDRASVASRKAAAAPRSGLRLALYARCSTEDLQSPEDSLQWQMRAATALIQRIDPEAAIVATYFDVGESRSLPWRRRTQAQRLLGDLDDPARPWDAIVVGEGKRCWFASQFSEVAPVLEHRGVRLFVPELGGEYDPKNSTHYTLMTLTGGMSRGERQTVQERVRQSMAAQVDVQGRFQGGRPPYGYRAEGFAPHPNPRKAAEGFQLKKLVLDEPAAAVVRRIFDEWLAGESLREIAHRLNCDGIDCPSARDRARNPHRAADGWQATTIATILENPRYTGHEAWGKFRKVEMLVDPDDPSWGHLTRLRRSTEPVIRSREQAHDAIVTVEEWVRAQAIRERKTVVGLKGERSRRTAAAYALKGMIHCASCTRKMGAERYNTKVDDPQRPRYVRYRCRSRDLVPGSPHAASHPANVRIKQADVLELLAEWMGELFSPDGIDVTVDALVGVAAAPNLASVRTAQLRQRLRDAEIRLGRLHQSIEAGVDPVALVARINAVQAEIDALTAEISVQPTAAATMPADEVAALVAEFANASRQVFGPEAEPADLYDFFKAINLSLVYDQPAGRLEAEINLGPKTLHPQAPELIPGGGGKDRVRGGT
jgi:DNA invertase Pin-like site-specific DNA recombinase